jgi:hypothetical protein
MNNVSVSIKAECINPAKIDPTGGAMLTIADGKCDFFAHIYFNTPMELWLFARKLTAEAEQLMTPEVYVSSDEIDTLGVKIESKVTNG